MRGDNRRPVIGAKYPGLHSLRHFYASWCINRRVDGGLELPLKVVQARLGHASIQMTADTYGHLFPRGDDGAELAAARKPFWGAKRLAAPRIHCIENPAATGSTAGPNQLNATRRSHTLPRGLPLRTSTLERDLATHRSATAASLSGRLHGPPIG